MANIPKALIFLRLVIGVLILVLSILRIGHFGVVGVSLFAVGLLTDIFDGIVARQLGVSTQQLRRLDSTVDQAFFIMVVVAAFIECRQFFYQNKVQLIILSGTEVMAYLICFLKFKKEIAIHSISSKIWTLILFATIIQILTTCKSSALFQICFYTGVITRIEIIGIILLLRVWSNDIPTIYHAFLIRQGKAIRRHKLFNG